MKRDLILAILAILTFFCIVFFIGKPFESFGCRHNRLTQDDVLNGVIKKKVKNSKSHSNEKIILKNGQVFEWEDNFYEDDAFFNKFEIGDTVIKKEGSLEIKVMRKENYFFIDLAFPCEED